MGKYTVWKVEKFFLGTGDRFGRKSLAKIQAIQAAQQAGAQIAPVWQKSNREHNPLRSEPGKTGTAGKIAARSAGFEGPIDLDADHIGLAAFRFFSILLMETHGYVTFQGPDRAEWFI